MQVCLMVRCVLVIGWQGWWLSVTWAWMVVRACRIDPLQGREERGEARVKQDGLVDCRLRAFGSSTGCVGGSVASVDG